MKTAAIIGAGIAGLACARRLHDAGWDVTLLEKSRGPGGRTATRRRDPHTWDHGAQFFTARSDAFQAQVRAWEAAGIVAPWTPRLVDLPLDAPPTPHPTQHPRYVGVPRMSRLARALSEGLRLQTSVRVAAIQRAPDGSLSLLDETAAVCARAARVVVSTPAAQAVPLLAPLAPHLAAAAEARAAGMTPCLAAMVTFAAPLDVPFDAAHVHGPGPLAWIARDSSKPGRPADAGDTWVLHATPDWSQDHLSLEGEELAHVLLAALRLRLGALPAVSVLLGHRWRYALAAAEPTPPESLYEEEVGIGVCGDWLCSPRVEGAWQSGDHLGRKMTNNPT